MRKLVIAVCLLLTPALAEPLRVSGHNLDVSVSERGELAVTHRLTGRTYRTTVPPAPPTLTIPQAAQSPVIDGDLGEWAAVPAVPIGSDMVSERIGEGSAPVCAAEARWLWDADHLYVAITVKDARLVFPSAATLRWWDYDSAEVWLGGTQVGFSVTPAGCLASRVSEPAAGCRVAMRQARLQRTSNVLPCADGAPAAPRGYTIEAAVPWRLMAQPPAVAVGAQVPVAVGVNDAGATGKREAQIYYPRTWRHSSPETFALATLGDVRGQVPGGAKPVAPVVSNLRRVPRGVSFRRLLSSPRGQMVQAEVQVTTARDADAIELTVDVPDRTVPFQASAFPGPLAADLEQGRICYAPYMDGIDLPQDSPKIHRWGLGPAHDLPFVGLYDAAKGDGYLLIAETPHDAQFVFQPASAKPGDKRLVPQINWLPELGKFGYTRKARIEFVAAGGYVAMARRYRALARRQGYVKTLLEKQRERPQLARLGGSPDVWAGDLSWAREAHARGMEQCLLNYTASRANMQAVNDLGWLTSRYDNYADLLEEKDPAKWDAVKGSLDMCYVLPDGKLMLGWLTWDKKMQYYERSSATAEAAARNYMPKDLEQHPYLARFLDVTTASGLYEDYHPQRTFGRRQDVEHRLALFRYTNSLKLVTGGEHGRFWAVPTMDYFEGMMSGNVYFSWPAGHLLRPEKGREGISQDYYTYGLGGEYRVPLFELVFHDCVVNYWYWGDSTDFLHPLDPKITDRKDALNVLYGTPPMYWINKSGFGRDPEAGWPRLMQSYRHTCRWHREVVNQEMTNHEYLTPDKLVQRTTFSGGFQAVANLATENRTVTVAGREVVLPPDGFVATGPDFVLERRVLDGRTVTRIRSAQYAFVDGGGRPVSVPGLSSSGQATVLVTAAERLRVAAHSAAAELNPAALVPGWDLGGMRLFRLDTGGQRVQALPLVVRDGRVSLLATKDVLELATGRETRLADLVLEPAAVAVSPAAPKQGEPLSITATVRNDGGSAVQGGAMVALVDGAEAARAPLNVAPRGQQSVTLSVPTAQLDGPRVLAVVAQTPAGQGEQLTGNNRVEQTVQVVLDRGRFGAQPLRVLTVTNGRLAQTDAVVTTPLTLPADVAPASIRVWDPAAGLALPAQFEPAAPNGRAGTLAVRLSGPLAAGATRRLEVLGQTGPATVLAPAGGFWRPDSQEIVTPAYALTLAAGVITDIQVRHAGAPRQPVIQQVGYSSGPTGWVQENGRLEAFDVLASGPVRTVIRVRRNLANGTTVYTKVYAFLADRFEVTCDAQPSVSGAHNRVYYLQGGTYTDSRAKTSLIDGKGDDDDHISGPPAAWLALRGNGWAHSVVALEPASGVIFWDSGNMGGLGLGGTAARSRQAFCFHPGQTDDTFARQDTERLLNLPKVQ